MPEKTDFVHLHTHSHYSLLQGLTKIPDLVSRAKSYGMNALALTDYGAMYGAISFYKECKKQEIKPILGVDAYMAFRTMLDKDHGIDNRRYPFTLLVKNEIGYKNLLKLVTQSHVKGFYYKPRMDKNLLREYSEGLICLSGPIYGELGQAVLIKNFEKAKDLIREYQEIFGKENYFIELMFNGHFEGLETLNKNLADLAREMGVEVVATQNSHYLDPEDREAFDTLIGISTTGVRARDNFMQGDFAFYDGNEMAERFRDYPEAIANTLKVSDMCNLELDLDRWDFPIFPIPEGKTFDDVLKENTYAGIEKRGLDKTEALVNRIEYELEIIKNKGYSSYFLIVGDMLQEAKKRGIYTNTRGSAAGSVVGYLNFISKVNPIDFAIPFERFMNPERPSIPDIDMDVADDKRDELIDYLREKYGTKAVAQIGTFGKMLAKGSVRDVARAFGYEYEKGDSIAKLIPLGKQGFPMTINRALKEEKDLAELYKNDPDTRKIIDMAKKIEGCARHISVHAAGVVVSPTRVDDYSPVQMDPKGGKIITQYDMYSGGGEGVVNLPKFDVLGIRNLSILANSVFLVKQIRKIDIDLDTIPLDDKKTFEMLSTGHTVGVFQLSGGGMTKSLVELKPTTIHDINAMVALYRPGPMQFIPEYIARRHDSKLIKYMDPALKNILERTYGVLVYQDDLLIIAHDLAGYTWGECDKFRKAVGKKIPEEMRAQKEKFVKGCINHSKWSEKKAEELWVWIEPFAAYGFNKAHSASYGLVAYQTAYMKANYPVEYMTAMLTAESGDEKKIAEIIHECEKMNIQVLPPDVNECFSDFTVIEGENENKIRFGFNTIKNFGEDIGKAIVAERKIRGKFKSLQDFLDRIEHKNLNKKSLEALIMAGAMDKFGERAQLLHNMEALLNYRREASKRDKDQISLFGDIGSANLKLEPCEPATKKQKLAWEKELLGLYVSGHPLEQHKEKFEKATWNIKRVLEEGKEEEKIIVGGIISEVKTIFTKKNNEKMAFIKLEDFTGSIEGVVFPRSLENMNGFLEEDACVVVKAKVSGRNGEKSLIIEGIKSI